MAVRTVRLLDNRQFVTRGVAELHPGGAQFLVSMDLDEVDAIAVDLADWLNEGEELLESTLTLQSGVSIELEDTPTGTTMTVSAGSGGGGEATLKLTTDAGRVKVLRFRFEAPECVARLTQPWDAWGP